MITEIFMLKNKNVYLVEKSFRPHRKTFFNKNYMIDMKKKIYCIDISLRLLLTSKIRMFYILRYLCQVILPTFYGVSSMPSDRDQHGR